MKIVKINKDNSQRKQSDRNRVKLAKLTLHKLNWLEWTTIIVGLWFLFFRQPYEILLGILLFIPIFGILLNGLHRPSIASLVDIDLKNKEYEYDVADFIDFAAWIILVRALYDYEFESIYSLIIPGTIAFIIILIILFSTHRLIHKSNRSKWWIYSSIIFNVMLYSYAGTYAANCTYDYSAPQVFETEVLDKYMRKRRKGGTYYTIVVAPWGHHLDKERIRVSEKKYISIEIGDKINMNYKKGLFNIPWYYVGGSLNDFEME